MRSITTPAQAVLAGPVAPLALLVRMAFAPTPVRLASSAVSIQSGSELYLAAGNLGAVDAIKDEANGTQGLRFALSGVPSANIALALDDAARGVPVTVALAVLDPATHALLDTPLAWSGTIDQMAIAHGPQTSTISVTAIHRGDILRRPKPLRYTDSDQQALQPGDTSLRYVASQAQVQDVWPAAEWGRQ